MRSRRRGAIEEFDRDVRAIVRTGQGTFRLAGRDDLAERFRPLLRRALRRNRRTESEQAGEQTAPAATDEPETAPAAETASEA